MKDLVSVNIKTNSIQYSNVSFYEYCYHICKFIFLHHHCLNIYNLADYINNSFVKHNDSFYMEDFGLSK